MFRKLCAVTAQKIQEEALTITAVSRGLPDSKDKTECRRVSGNATGHRAEVSPSIPQVEMEECLTQEMAMQTRRELREVLSAVPRSAQVR